MYDLIRDLVLNILGELFFWLGIGFIVFLYIRTLRKKFNRFFGLYNSNSITIVLSNLWDSTITDKKQWGEVVAGLEMNGARELTNMFSSASLGFPEIVRGLIDNYWINEKFTSKVIVSEKNYQYRFNDETVILIGATTKNSRRRYFVKNNKCLVKIKGEPTKDPIDIHKNNLRNEFIINQINSNGDSKTWRNKYKKPIALIERIEILDPEPGSSKRQVVFMCAGITSRETRLAMLYLKRNWRKIEDQSKNKKRFALLFSFNDENNLEFVPIPISD